MMIPFSLNYCIFFICLVLFFPLVVPSCKGIFRLVRDWELKRVLSDMGTKHCLNFLCQMKGKGQYLVSFHQLKDPSACGEWGQSQNWRRQSQLHLGTLPGISILCLAWSQDFSGAGPLLMSGKATLFKIGRYHGLYSSLCVAIGTSFNQDNCHHRVSVWHDLQCEKHIWRHWQDADFSFLLPSSLVLLPLPECLSNIFRAPALCKLLCYDCAARQDRKKYKGEVCTT